MKADALKNLNKKIPQLESLEDITPSSNNGNGAVSNRKSWQKETDLTPLENKTLLAQTIMPNGKMKNEESAPGSARKAWDVPHDTIIKALENAEVRLLNTENKRFEETLKPLTDDEPKFALKRGQTFIIDKKTNRKLPVSSNHNTLLVDEKPPEILGNINSIDDVASMELIISPLKQTKSIILGVTLGKFDAMNTKMLRTCSEPDLTKLMSKEDSTPREIASESPKHDPKSEVNKVDNHSNTEKLAGTIRCARSLDDLDKMSEDIEIIEESSDDSSKV